MRRTLTADEERQKKIEEVEKRRMADLLYAYKTLFDSPNGKLVLDDLRIMCNADTGTADVNNVNLTYFREGARGVILRIEKYLKLKPEDITNGRKNGKARTE
jgi:hypothetical protein